MNPQSCAEQEKQSVIDNIFQNEFPNCQNILEVIFYSLFQSLLTTNKAEKEGERPIVLISWCYVCTPYFQDYCRYSFSKPYQFKISLRELIPENIKLFEVNGKPQL